MAAQGWHLRADRIAGIDRTLVISNHARQRIRERFNWTDSKIRAVAKEVGKIYYKLYRGVKVEIPYEDSIWIIKTAEDGKALVKTVIKHQPDYSMSEFL
jgi:hypothetical protein